MRIRSNLPGWLTINDIGVSLPPKGKGDACVDNEKGLRSEELLSLIRTGKVAVERENMSIRPATLEGDDVYLVPGHHVWGAGGAAPTKAETKPFEFSTLVRKSAEVVAKQSRRYRVRRACEFNISLDKAGISLNRHRPDAVLDADAYHAEDVQKAIASGHIELSEILEMRIDEEGRSSWVSIETPKGMDKAATLAADGQPCVFWEGPIFDAGGYANMNRQYCFHLHEMGIHVKPALVSTLMDVEPAVRQKLVEMSHNLIPVQSPKVFATNIPNRHVGRSISYTMMETENRIHDQLVQRLLVADEIWVPCEWNRRVFLNSGVNREIRVMPLGVDEVEYHPAKRSAIFDSGTKGFTFLSVFNWNWRKAPDVLLKAYIRAFTSKDDVSLVMVSRYVGQTSMSGQIYKDIKSYTAGERESDRPHVMLVDEVIPTFLMPRLYNSADAFVLFSRGEGWGLPAIEAAASGTPLLTSYHGGHEMFLDDSTAMLLTPDKVTPVHESVKWISPFYHDMEFADYSDKAVDRAAAMMREMYENRKESAERAARCRQKIIENFTWRHAAERVAARLKHIQP